MTAPRASVEGPPLGRDVGNLLFSCPKLNPLSPTRRPAVCGPIPFRRGARAAHLTCVGVAPPPRKEIDMVHELPIVFLAGSVPLVERFFRNTANIAERQPCVLVTGSWRSVKEQMPAVYAARLAKAGHTAFTLDFSGFGRSQGCPRQAEIPDRKIGDIVAAAHFASTMRPDRGAVPERKNAMAEMTWAYRLAFDGRAAADEVAAPALFVRGDGCVLPDNVRKVHDRLKGPKDLVWTGGDQVDFYDLPDAVGRAMNAVRPWFRLTLAEI